MNHQQRCLRVGAAAILCSLIFRLGLGGFFQPVGEFLARPSISSMLLYLETGRIVRFSTSSEDFPLFARESATPSFDIPPAETVPAFSAQDMALVTVKYYCTKDPDLEALMGQPLSWNLVADAPTVLILHTHGTESYTKSPGERYTESSAYRTLDENYNMISLGDRLAQALESAGIGVIHDRSLHDYPSYSGSYSAARKSIAKVLEEYPSIQLVLDLHRDASGDDNNQLKTAATVDGQKSAQLMLVVGTDASGLSHPEWEENLALALKLYAQLERNAPGICRYISLRSQRFNQDQHPGAMIVEVGGAGNSHSEAEIATDQLAQAVIDMAKGVEIS